MTADGAHYGFVTGAPSYAETPSEGASLPTMWATLRGTRRPCDVLRRGPERILSMEGGCGIGGILHVLDRFPHSLLRATIYPIHQVLQLPSLNLQIQDPSNLIFQFTFHF